MQYNPEELNEILRIYSSESEEIIDRLNENFLLLEKNPSDKAPIKQLLRLVHSLKGASRMLGFNSIQDISHKLEDILSFWDKDNNSINSDMFQEIYNVCDFLLMLVHKSVEYKTDYVDKNVMVFINKLDNFLTYNQINSAQKDLIEKDEYINSKSMDINAIILELMFVLENVNISGNLEEIKSVLIDNISNIEDIFNKTKYDEIKNKILILKEKTLSNDFQTKEIKSLILDLRNSIYNLYKTLNIHYEFNKLNEIRKNTSGKKDKNADNNGKIIENFDFILNNLQKIKFDKNVIIEITTRLRNLSECIQNESLKILYSKIIKIMSIINDKDIVVDNECYVVLLQSIFFIKRCQTEETKENIGNINLLLQRLSLVEDIYGFHTSETVQNPIDNVKTNPIGCGEYRKKLKNI